MSKLWKFITTYPVGIYATVMVGIGSLPALGFKISQTRQDAISVIVAAVLGLISHQSVTPNVSLPPAAPPPAK